jgi:hypothetical protein
MLDAFYIIVSSSLAFLSGVISISNWIKSLNKEFDTQERWRMKIIGTVGAFIVVGFVSFLYFYFGRELFNAHPEPIKKEIIDISGCYTGYFVDDLGQEIPTYLRIEDDFQTDSVILYFKNAFSSTCKAKYEKEDNSLNTFLLGKGIVRQAKGFVIIESPENQKNKWKFTKDLMCY